MNHSAMDEMFKDLVANALDGQQSKFEFIRNLEQLHLVNTYIKGTKKVVKVFKNMRKALLEGYLEKSEAGEDCVEILLALKRYQKCYDFYVAELKTAKDMRYEYKNYVISGHILDTLLGVDRKVTELTDHRWF